MHKFKFFERVARVIFYNRNDVPECYLVSGEIIVLIVKVFVTF